MQAFWLLAGVGFRYAGDSVAIVPLFFAGLAGALLFYGTVFRVAAREQGRPVASSWFPLRRRRGSAGDWPVVFRIIDPR